MRNTMTEQQAKGGNLSLDDLQRQLAQLERQVQMHLKGNSKGNRSEGIQFDAAQSAMKQAARDMYMSQLESNDVHRGQSREPLAPQAQTMSSRDFAKQFTKPFCEFMTDNPTVYHAVDAFKSEMKAAGWTELNERDEWDIKPSGHYFVERSGSSLISFVVGAEYKAGNGAAVIGGHIDALTGRLKPVSKLPSSHGFLQMGVAPYAGAFNSTWWDRDLGIAGRVLVQEGDKVVPKLVKLDWPIARIPTLAAHFGAAAQGPFDKESQMVPIIGLEDIDASEFNISNDKYPHGNSPDQAHINGFAGSFISTQPESIVKLVADAIGLSSKELHKIVNWELQLFDFQPATVGGVNKDFIFAGRIDDKLCSWAAMRALLDGAVFDTHVSSVIKMVALFDNEEVGSQSRQGAQSNFLPMTLERIVSSMMGQGRITGNTMGRTYANSFLVSADVNHAVNPNFLGQYLPQHMPRLNVGVSLSADGDSVMTTDSMSTAIFKRCTDKTGAKLQVFQAPNGKRGGGTIGPMLSAMTGIRSIDAGIPQLSMHSIRATTGSLDPGLGALAFMGFLNGYESVDKQFRP